MVKIAYLLGLVVLTSKLFAQTDTTDFEQQNLNFQTSKGKFQTNLHFGMGLGFQNTQIAFENSTALLDVYLSPRVGYFVLNRWLVGVSSEITNSVASFNYNNNYSFLSYTTGILSRYYTQSVFFAEAEYGWGFGNERYHQNKSLVRNVFPTGRLGIGIGIANFWFKRFAFDLMVKYANLQSNKFNFNNFNITAGLSYSFGKGYCGKLFKGK